MTDYRWSCQACEQVNEAGVDVCKRCGCPGHANSTDIEAHRAKYKATKGEPYKCLKCSHNEYEVGEARMSGGLTSSLLEIETEMFTFISCRQCGYTEFYRGKRGVMEVLLDYGI